MDKHEAQAALAAMDTSREKVAALIEDTPMWRHLAFGAVMAAIVGSAPLDTPLQVGGTVIGLFGVFILLNYDRRTYGAWVSGVRKGKTLPLTITIMAALIAAIVFGLEYRGTPEAEKMAALIAAAVLVVGTGFSVLWTKIYVDEIRKGDA